MDSSLSNFSQLRNVLDNSIPQQDVHRGPVNESLSPSAPTNFSGFGQSKEFPSALASPHNYSQNRRSVRMDELVQDLNSALDESTAGSRPKRKVWRRRCKSTSNLAAIMQTNRGQPTSGPPGRSQNNSIDETSTSSEGEMADDAATVNPQLFEVIDRKDDRGTSSLQLSDSDETCSLNNLSSNPAGGVDTQIVSKRLTPHYSSTVRKKRANSLLENKKDSPEAMTTNEPVSTGQKRDRYAAGLYSESPDKGRANAALESDSLNETFSPLRPNTKRKRKCKRIALDPESATAGSSSVRYSKSKSKSGPVPGGEKRKKMRSRSACMQPQVSSKAHFNSPQPSMMVIGKRKRSNREKSVETDSNANGSNSREGPWMTSKHAMDVDRDTMDIEDDTRVRHRGGCSSSSLSSSDWEDASDADERVSQPEIDDHEADDEQSDWPGHAEEGSSTIYGPSDDEFNAKGMALDEENLNSLTSTARQAYLARMKRLAECVPGREIRAGARRLRTRQRGFTIKSSSSEQVSRFLQDARRTELKLTVIRSSDRNKIAHLANLYSLSLRHEANHSNPASHLIVLTKTGRTLKPNEEFIVPNAPTKPSSCPNTDVKRRRREILSDNPTDQTVEIVNLCGAPQPGSDQQPSPSTSTSTNEPQSPANFISEAYQDVD